MALLKGELVAEGRCLYIIGHEFGDKWFPVFPSNSVTWDGSTLTWRNERFEIGDSVSLGGGEISGDKFRRGLEFLQEPDGSCDVRHVWMVSP
jgi:hypothetical protein